MKKQAEAKAGSAANGGGAGVAPTVVVTRDNIEQEVITRSTQVPVVVQVGTGRSPGSENMRAAFSDLAAKGKLKWVFAYIDADTTPELAQMLGVQGLPTVLALAGGQPLTSFEGEQPAEQLPGWIDAIVRACEGKLEGLPESAADGAADNDQPSDPRFVAAEQALDEGRFDDAIGIYDDVLAQEPANRDARKARDAARFSKRLATAGGGDAVAAADADPTDVDKALAAADAEIAAGHAEAAFTRLLDVMVTSAGEDKNTLRIRLVELFDLFEATDPRVIAARSRMASALY
nr:tetratricopeptide repeat protein [Corynebacterium mendelii]